MVFRQVLCMSNFKDNSGLEKEKPKMSEEERKELMKKFLEKGGKVQKLGPGYPINVGSLDKSKKPRYTKQEVESGKDKGTAPMPDLTSIRKQEAFGNIKVSYNDKVPVYEPGYTGDYKKDK